MKKFDPTKLIRVEIDLNIPDSCEDYGTEMIIDRRNYEQWGSRINTVARNFLYSVCLECGIETYKSGALLKYKE